MGLGLLLKTLDPLILSTYRTILFFKLSTCRGSFMSIVCLALRLSPNSRTCSPAAIEVRSSSEDYWYSLIGSSLEEEKFERGL